MSRKIMLDKFFYGENFSPIFKKTEIEFQPGLTVLVGCNGSGKTTMLKQIKNNLTKEGEETPYLLYDNYKNGIKGMISATMSLGDFSLFKDNVFNSEGEGIVTALLKVSCDMGILIRNNPNANEYWFLFDAVDSGLSIDNIIDVKQNLFKFVLNDCKSKDIYIIVSANSYEFASGEQCLDVAKGKYITFKGYKGYRRFILNSEKIKQRRYDKDNKIHEERNKK